MLDTDPPIDNAPRDADGNRPLITWVEPRGGGAMPPPDRPARPPHIVTTPPIPVDPPNTTTTVWERLWLTATQVYAFVVPTFTNLTMTRNQKITAFIVGLAGLIATNFMGVDLSPAIQTALNLAVTAVLAWLVPAPKTVEPTDAP